MELSGIIHFLKKYDGPQLKFMEVCGTHTSSIAKSGIRSLISPKIRLISGPGCPVCVTPAAYIDKCIGYAFTENHVLVTFGDMMKVPGSAESLSEAKSRGGRVELMYSPFEVLEKAAENTGTTYIIAAVGFETTAPVYALLLKEAGAKGLKNIKLLTALKSIAPALSWICENEKKIDGFICPGHVSVITGAGAYEKLSTRYGKPFVIAGFEPEHILAGVCELILMSSGEKQPGMSNLYRSAVKDGGNVKAQGAIAEYFKTGDAMWRGIGIIENSGYYLKEKYAGYDGGSFGLDGDTEFPDGCRCADIIAGRADPGECSMFGVSCTPQNPFGPCMVSAEGACGIWFQNTGKR